MDKKTSMYEKDDFIDVVDANGAPHPPIPKQWLGTEHAPGFKKAPKDGEKAPAAPVQIPTGEPTDDWTIPQIDKYVADNSVDLGDAKKKDQKLPLIVAHYKAAQQS
jgi:hypothetical protein